MKGSAQGEGVPSGGWSVHSDLDTISSRADCSRGLLAPYTMLPLETGIKGFRFNEGKVNPETKAFQNGCSDYWLALEGPFWPQTFGDSHKMIASFKKRGTGGEKQERRWGEWERKGGGCWRRCWE